MCAAAPQSPSETHPIAQAYGATVLVLFFAGYFGAQAFGVWDNKISDGEYVQRIQENQIDSYGHPGM